MNNEELKYIFDNQKDFQSKTLGVNVENLSTEERSKLIHQHAHFLMEESIELLRPLPYHKEWKDYSKWTERDIHDAFKESQKEAIDSFIFLVNVMFLLGIESDDVVNMYNDKLKINKERQENPELGYVNEKKKIETPEQSLAKKDIETRSQSDLQDEKYNEEILVGSRTAIPSRAYKNKVNDVEVLKSFLTTIKTVKRGHAEHDFAKVQPIPYTILTRDDEIFVYSRLNKSGETRLVDKVSIGVGGHMNEVPGSLSFSETLEENSIREITEELNISMFRASEELSIEHAAKNSKDLKRVHKVLLMNDTDVDKVHVGLVQFIEIKKGFDITVKETDVLQGEFVNKQELLDSMKRNPEKFENWTLALKDYL